MKEVNKAIKYFVDAIKETDGMLDDCSSALKIELEGQRAHLATAVKIMRMQRPRAVNPHIRIYGIFYCPVCGQDLAHDEDLRYCPTCGQRVKMPAEVK